MVEHTGHLRGPVFSLQQMCVCARMHAHTLSPNLYTNIDV